MKPKNKRTTKKRVSAEALRKKTYIVHKGVHRCRPRPPKLPQEAYLNPNEYKVWFSAELMKMVIEILKQFKKEKMSLDDTIKFLEDFHERKY